MSSDLDSTVPICFRIPERSGWLGLYFESDTQLQKHICYNWKNLEPVLEKFVQSKKQNFKNISWCRRPPTSVDYLVDWALECKLIEEEKFSSSSSAPPCSWDSPKKGYKRAFRVCDPLFYPSSDSFYVLHCVNPRSDMGLQDEFWPFMDFLANYVDEHARFSECLFRTHLPDGLLFFGFEVDFPVDDTLQQFDFPTLFLDLFGVKGSDIKVFIDDLHLDCLCEIINPVKTRKSNYPG